MFDSTGWIDTAFVVSVDATRTGSVYPIGTHVGFINLMQSVREHSKAAVLAFSTGKPGQRSPLLPRDAETEFTQLVHFYIEDEMPVRLRALTLSPHESYISRPAYTLRTSYTSGSFLSLSLSLSLSLCLAKILSSLPHLTVTKSLAHIQARHEPGE